MKNVIKVRVVLSSLLLITFFVVLLTGIGLYLAPIGRIARETSWLFLGIDKDHLEKLHTVFGFIMSGIIFVHLVINFGLFKQELKTLFKQNNYEYV